MTACSKNLSESSRFTSCIALLSGEFTVALLCSTSFHQR
ncbi:Uncharacterised protein [Vibrio cholerae]|nr:Uncharacterised protein [Vibrio cholerae]